MTTGTTRLTRLDSLTGVRAFAVFLVFWHHAANRFDDVTSSGMVGVSLFYLISGFVMSWTDQNPDGVWRFYRKRFARIYPAYALVCVLCIGWLLAVGNFEPGDLFAFTLLQAWVPDSSIYYAAQAVFWSLSVEVFFYLVFPALRLVLRRMDRRKLLLTVVVAAALSITVGVVGSTFPVNDFTHWLFVVLPVVRLPEFVIGAALGALYVSGWRPNIGLAWTLPLAAVAVIAAAFAPYATSQYAVTLIPFTLLVCALATADLEQRWSIMRARPIVALGVWSFAFYLIHGPVLWVSDAVGARLDIPVLVTVLAAFPIAVAAAYLLYRFVERPAEGKLRPAPARANSETTPTR